MNPIRAFVGHSFLPEDQTVVRAFTDYLTTLAESLPSFMWQDAERAEPNTLSEKVLRIARDKNLFIGICTVKEGAVPTSSLSSAWPWRSYVKAKADEFAFKTSDWVIQEIGMAIGMGMKTILLRETGLRLPGGLQGNTEYIEFDRNHPTEAFPKLLQMISGSSPKEATALITAPMEIDSTEKTDEPDATTSAITFTMPEPGWDRFTYEFASFRAIRNKDDATLQRIDTAYRKTPIASTHDDLRSWEAHIELARIRFQFNGDLERLIALAAENPKNSKIKEALARAYAFYKERELAASTFVAASDIATNDAMRQARLFKSAAEQYVLDRKFEKAKSLASRIKDSIGDTAPNELVFLQTLNTIASAEKDERVQIAAMERIVELKPADTNARFNLALKQSEHGNADLALHHYLNIPKDERSSAVWNNLGVEFDKFSLPAKAVDAFVQAADEGETLAMSNLGNKLVNQGFLKEAKILSDRALQIESHAKNVHDLVSRLTEAPEAEQQREEEILSEAKSKSDFYREVGRAIAGRDGNQEINRSAWVDRDCTLHASHTGATTEIVGTFERDRNALAGLLGLLGTPYGNSSPLPPQKVKHSIRYVGRFEGRAFFGTVDRKSDGQSLVADAATKNEVIMVLSRDGSTLEVLEGPQSQEPKFYTLRRSVAE